MNDCASPDEVAAALANPRTSSADLAQIVRQHPEFGVQVAGHPNVYPALLDWLAKYGNDASRAAAQQALSDMETPPDVTVLRAPAVTAPAAVQPVVTPVVVGAPAAHAPVAGKPEMADKPGISGYASAAVAAAHGGADAPADAPDEVAPAEPAVVTPEPVNPKPVTPAPAVFSSATSTPTAPAPATLGAGIASGARGAATELKDIWKGDPKDKVGSALERVGIVGGVLKYIIIAVVVVVVAIFGLRACSASAAAKNVTCSQFSSMSSSQQDSTLKALLSAHGDTTDETNVELAYAKVGMGCMMASPSTKIDSVVNW